MHQDIDRVLERLPSLSASIEDLRETLVGNVVMTAEIPAPTFGEQDRAGFLRDRFAEEGLQNASIDEVDNAVGVLPGTEGERNILLVAHIDTVGDHRVLHDIQVLEDRVIGPGVGDNSLGVATLASLPTIFEHLGIALESNLILLGATRSFGRGDLAGLRFFLDHARMPIQAGLCVEGVPLGRLSYSSLGMVRAEIRVEVPEEYDWSRFGARGAIRILNDVIHRIDEIPLPRTPRTNILFGSIRGGSTFDSIAYEAKLQFEIRSESSDTVKEVRSRIEEITDELTAEAGARVVLDPVARRSPGGIGFGHPLVKSARTIMQKLGIDPRIVPSAAELSLFIGHGIPAVTLGVTKGHNLHEPDEEILISPMFTGLAQLIGVLLAMDEGISADD
jgi:acetylornithine deacetylase/succinyl-diaminopimelate desuccinylase-like protein